MLRTVLLLAGLAAGVAAGCHDFALPGGPAPFPDAGPPDASPDADAPQEAVPSEVHVLIRNLAFEPMSIRIKVGTTVVWDMEDTGTFHFVVEGDPGGGMPAFDSGRLDTGQTWTHTFMKPGTYSYFCSNHSTVMRGNQIVVEP